MKSILFVCTGNTCRSPLAEGLFKKMLTRIFHTDSSRGAANPDGDKEGDGLRRRLYVSYCPRKTSSSTQHPSGFPTSAVDRCEICGLTSHHQFAVTSAGLHAMEGMPASPHTLEVLREQGIDFSLFRSQLVTNALVEQATHVFVMTHAHLRELSILYPAYQKKFFLLNEGTTQDDITDPIGGSLAAYQECGQRIQQALKKILIMIDKNLL